MNKKMNRWRGRRSPLARAALVSALAASAALAQDFPTTLQSDNPYSYWPFSEATVAPPLDTVTNSVSPSFGTGYIVADVDQGEPGIVGNSVRFNNPDFSNADNVGDATSKVEFPWNAALDPLPPFSVEFWAKPTQISSDTTGLCAVSSMNPYYLSANRSGYIFYLGVNGWLFRVGGQSSYASPANPSWTGSTKGDWDYVVGEFDGTTVSLYVNGTLAATSTVAPGSFNVNNFAPTRIGSTLFYGNDAWSGTGLPGSGNRGWDGWVDEVGVYNKLLTPSQINAHFAAATTNKAGYHSQILSDSPTAYWSFEEGAFAPSSTNSVAVNLGSIGAEGEGTNTLGAQAGQAPPPYSGFPSGSHSVFFSGSEGSMLTGPGLLSTDVSGQPITYLAWIKPQQISGWRAIIEQGWNSSDVTENFFRIGDLQDWETLLEELGLPASSLPPTGPYQVYEVGAFNANGYFCASTPVPAGDVGNWVFLAGTWDGANWNLYRDGQLVATYPDSTGPAEVSAEATGVPHWTIGSLSDPQNISIEDAWYFSGDISQPAILTGALTGNQIAALYAAAKVAPVITTPPVAPPTAVYLGSSVTFTVGVDGAPPLSYQWVSNGIALAGQTATNFTLNNVSAAADGTYSVIVSNAYGTATSSVVLAVTPTLPPVSVSPAVETRWNGFPFEFDAAGVGSATVNYKWLFDGTATGTTSSNIVGTANSGTAGSYSVIVNNSLGSATSSVPGVLNIVSIPAGYPATILADHPIAYYRLDETSGTVAHDYAGGHDGVYNNVILDQPGYVPTNIDADPAVTFTGAANSYIGGIAPTSINFAGVTNFSIEAWANGAAGGTTGAIVAKGTGNVGNGGIANEQFDLLVNAGSYSFLVRSPANSTQNGYQCTGTTGPDGVWHHLVGVWDGANVYLYVDGQLQAQAAGPGTIRSSTFPISIGAERSGNDPTYDVDFNGSIDEVAIYNYALSADQIAAHYGAAYGSALAPHVTLQPTSLTNYEGLAVTFNVGAYGTVPINYQWNKVGSGAISGANGTSLTIAPLSLSDSGTYFVGITNSIGGTTTQPFTLTVLPPPATPPAIPDLVVHLTFDNTLTDASGRGNNGTNMASGAYTPRNNYDTAAAKIGSAALVYETDTNSADTNVSAYYVSLGVRQDLQFSSNVDFTVAFWIKEPDGYIGNDLPFFTDVPGSTYGYPGYVFAPTFGGSTSGWAGGWAYSLYDTSDTGIGVYGDVGSINDGGWHHLAYVFNRKYGEVTYLDGVSFNENSGDFAAQPYVQAGTTAGGLGDIDNSNPATIGQDPTGNYGQIGGPFEMDDFLVFRRALTPIEVGAIYAAGSETPGLSVTNVPTVSGTFTYSLNASNNLVLSWTAGTLQASTNVAGPYTDTTATSPYTVPETNTAKFFRVKF